MCTTLSLACGDVVNSNVRQEAKLAYEVFVKHVFAMEDLIIPEESRSIGVLYDEPIYRR